MYAIWRERNKVKHREQALPIPILMKLTEKGVRNKLSLMRNKKGVVWNVDSSFGLELEYNLHLSSFE